MKCDISVTCEENALILTRLFVNGATAKMFQLNNRAFKEV